VHPYAKLAWSVLAVAQKVCIIYYKYGGKGNVCVQVLQTQQNRDDKVRGPWEIILDNLDFMRQANPPQGNCRA
jgi:hypothetical protein